MKAVILDVPDSMIEERRRRGIDRRDEVWEGVYHMVPPPSFEHQRIVDDLLELLRGYCRRHALGVLNHGLAVRDAHLEAGDYRIPEWLFLRAGREHLLRPSSGFVDEGPDAILEVRSPGDETDEKVPFYERVGVGEVLVVDRDSRRVDLLRHVSGRLLPVSPNEEGWTYSEALRAFFRTGECEARPVLLVRLEIDRSEHAI